MSFLEQKFNILEHEQKKTNSTTLRDLIQTLQHFGYHNHSGRLSVNYFYLLNLKYYWVHSSTDLFQIFLSKKSILKYTFLFFYG